MSILNAVLVVEANQESFIKQHENNIEPSNAEKLADMVLKINLSNVTEDGSVGVGQGYLAMMREVAKEIKGVWYKFTNLYKKVSKNYWHGKNLCYYLLHKNKATV